MTNLSNRRFYYSNLGYFHAIQHEQDTRQCEIENLVLIFRDFLFTLSNIFRALNTANMKTRIIESSIVHKPIQYGRISHGGRGIVL